MLPATPQHLLPEVVLHFVFDRYFFAFYCAQGQCWVTTLARSLGRVFCVDIRGSSLVCGTSTNRIVRLGSVCTEDNFSFVPPPGVHEYDCESHVYCLQGSSDDAHHVVAGCADGTVQVWSTRTHKRLFTPVKHDHWVFGLQFDSERLVSASYDGNIKQYDLVAHQTVNELFHRKGAT